MRVDLAGFQAERPNRSRPLRGLIHLGVLGCWVFLCAAEPNLLLQDRHQVILLGDSLTEGEDPDGYVNVTRLLLAALFPEMKVFTANAGKGGDTVVHLANRLDRDVLPFRPDWVTVSIGVNDVNRGFDAAHPSGDGPDAVLPPQFKDKLTEVVRRIQERGTKVVLLTPTVSGEDLSGPRNRRLELYANAAREVAEERGCILADANRAFREVLRPKQAAGMASSGILTVDGVHFRPDGAWLMAKTLLQAWGVAGERIDRIRPAVEEQVRAQASDLARRLARYEEINHEVGLPCAGQRRIVFFGSSSVDLWNLAREFPDVPFLNRGISGETSREMRQRFHQDVVALKPTAAILFLGSGNDFMPERRMSVVDTKSYIARMGRMAKGSGIQLAIGSLMPVNDYLPGKDHVRTHPIAEVQELNEWIRALCAENGYLFIDFYHAVVDDRDRLRRELSDDGMHCNAAGYAVWKPIVRQAIPQLLP